MASRAQVMKAIGMTREDAERAAATAPWGTPEEMAREIEDIFNPPLKGKGQNGPVYQRKITPEKIPHHFKVWNAHPGFCEVCKTARDMPCHAGTPETAMGSSAMEPTLKPGQGESARLEFGSDYSRPSQFEAVEAMAEATRQALENFYQVHGRFSYEDIELSVRFDRYEVMVEVKPR